jgi:hypothetical protein
MYLRPARIDMNSYAYTLQAQAADSSGLHILIFKLNPMQPTTDDKSYEVLGARTHSHYFKIWH